MNDTHKFPNLNNLVKLHNDARLNSWFGKLKKLEHSEELTSYAISWSSHMAKENTLTHSSMKDIMKLGFVSVGENIAYGQKTEKDVMKSWLWSPGHRHNIMNKSFTHIGCGFSYSTNDIIYWCVCFGRKKLKDSS